MTIKMKVLEDKAKQKPRMSIDHIKDDPAKVCIM